MKKLIAVATVAALALILAPTASAQVYVKNGGKLGIGDFETTDPVQPLHLKQPGNTTFQFESGNLGGVRWNFKIDGNGNFAITRAGGASGAEMVLKDQSEAIVLDIKGNIEADDFIPSSSRALKEGFAPMDPSEVLDKVVGMPITRWWFKDDPRASQHIGPMAEDFYAAFATGAGDKHISLIDANGVAFAAIQGLHQQAQEKDRLIADLLSRIERLEQRLAER